MVKRREIRNSTAEFLIFQIEGKEQGVEVYYKDLRRCLPALFPRWEWRVPTLGMKYSHDGNKCQAVLRTRHLLYFVSRLLPNFSKDIRKKGEKIKKYRHLPSAAKNPLNKGLSRIWDLPSEVPSHLPQRSRQTPPKCQHFYKRHRNISTKYFHEVDGRLTGGVAIWPPVAKALSTKAFQARKGPWEVCFAIRTN